MRQALGYAVRETVASLTLTRQTNPKARYPVHLMEFRALRTGVVSCRKYLDFLANRFSQRGNKISPYFAQKRSLITPSLARRNVTTAASIDLGSHPAFSVLQPNGSVPRTQPFNPSLEN